MLAEVKSAISFPQIIDQEQLLPKTFV